MEGDWAGRLCRTGPAGLRGVERKRGPRWGQCFFVRPAPWDHLHSPLLSGGGCLARGW